MSSSKPSVLILGGISTFASPLVSLLVEQDKASFIRIADKASVSPATIYISPELASLLDTRKDLIEYKQANLTVSSTVTSIFDPPPGKEPFLVVYDLTGERDSSRPEIMLMTQTTVLAALLGAEAQRRNVDSYVRVSYPYYKMSGSEKGGHKEGSKLVPDGPRGQWWHEASRALANLPDLNLVILGIGAEYGENSLTGVVLPRIVAGHIYKYLKQDMKLLWSSDLKIHTIHQTDVVLAATLAADWLKAVGGRAKADAVAGVDLPPSGVKKDQLADLKRACPVDKTPKGCVFHIVDDASSTQDKIATAISKYFGIKHDYYGAVTQLFAKLAFKDVDFADMVEDANEMHLEAWGEMLQKNAPPIDNSPISPYLPEHEFQKNAINLDGSKARKVLGFVPKHPGGITVEEVEKIVKGFQSQNLWPKTT